ncbi:hypothetical protein RB594_006001 [Gaeumannomyces avenae]
MATTKAAPVVWINGFPGCGKLTVATAIRALDETVIVLDNHKLIDLVEERVARTHPSYQHERRCFRQAVLKENVCDPAGLSRLVVFTDFQSDNELGRAVASEYKDAAISAGRSFVPVYLTCDVATNLERVTSIARLTSRTTKLIDRRALEDIRSRCKLFRFPDCPSLTVDSSNLTPLDAAAKILAFARGAAFAADVTG